MMLKTKILTGYGVAFALTGLVIAWAITNLVSLGQATDAILRENYKSIIAVENMSRALERQSSGVLLICSKDGLSGRAQLKINDVIFRDWLLRAKANITINGESELVSAIDTGYEQYRRKLESFAGFDKAEDVEFHLPVATYQKEIYPLLDKVLKSCLKLRQLNEGVMYGASTKAGEVANRAIWSTVFATAFAVILALVFSLVLAERIVRPIRHFAEASRQISAGDYSVQVVVDSGDELGGLAEEFNQMTRRLNHFHKMNIDEIISEKAKGDAIISSIEDSLIVFDVNLKVTGINPAACQLLEVGSSQALQMCCDSLLTDPNVAGLIHKTVESGIQQDVPDEERIVSFSGGDEERHFLFSVTSICGRDRKLSGIVLLFRDITRLKAIEHLKNEFVLAASHELRTPLTSLGMSIELLIEHVAPKLANEECGLLQAADEEVHRMKALVSDLLDLSRLEAGSIALEFESVKVGTLFSHVEKVFQSQVDMKNVNFSCMLIKAIPELKIDANKITWVLSNLVSNALRYVDKGGIIELTAERIGRHVHLSVYDNGPGIPEEYQSRIFEKFVQVKGQVTGGTGLGLAICKEIVGAHGGNIWVESTIGEGSTFTFSLPLAETK
jgi:NtrC-family two-component system sensor histidine kinase KinB